MNTSEILEFMNSITITDTISTGEVPELDLYMDQVITLFENKLSAGKRNEDDKILTKTMINNYAKDKLLQPIKNKKYTKENILLLILIYNLKQSLSISDIKLFLNSIDDDVIDLYDSYVDRTNLDYENFKEEINDTINNDDSPESIHMLILSLINKSNMYRKFAENLLDNYIKKEV